MRTYYDPKIDTQEKTTAPKSITDLALLFYPEPEKMKIIITNEIVGWTRLYGFSKEKKERTNNTYMMPVYKVLLVGKDKNDIDISIDEFKAVRFGVLEEEGLPKIVGLSDTKVYVASGWIDNYDDIGFDDIQKGAWKFNNNFKVIDGIQDAVSDSGEAYGNIEIFGSGEFERMNNLILNGLNIDNQTTLGKDQIAKSGLLEIEIQGAVFKDLTHLTNTPNNEHGAILRITDNVIGYTIQHVYGRPGASFKRRIVVPVYELELENPRTGKVFSYGVTRDSWYARGEDTSGKKPHNLTNRAFEPLIEKQLFDSRGINYPEGTLLEAFELAQLRNNKLDIPERKKIRAEPFSKEQNTYLDTTPIDDAREDPDIATSVMIHIGGYYSKGSIDKLAGSYGCFGLVQDELIFKTEQEAQDIIDNDTLKNFKTGNDYYNSFMTKVKTVRDTNYNVGIEIVKRKNVEKFKTVNDNGQ